MTLLLALYLAAALALGGATGQGGWRDAVLAVPALPLLAWGAWRLRAVQSRLVAPLLALVLATLALPLVQLLPWEAAPGVGGAFGALHAAFGVQPPAELSVAAHRAWTLDPNDTRWALMALLPPLAVLVGAVGLDPSGRRRLLGVVLAMAALQAVVAILQTPQGGAVLGAFHDGSHGYQARGFFSNRNHLGLLMVIGTGLGIAQLWQRAAVLGREGWHWRQGLAAALAAAAALLCLVTLLLSQSRAAVAIGLLLGVIGAIALVRQSARQAGGRRLLVALAGMLLLAVNLGAYGVMQRFAADPLDDARALMARQTAALALEAMPLGTGLGSFQEVYAQREPALGLADAHTNQAHNDYLQIWLETGILGLLLALAWIGLMAWRLRAARPWSPDTKVAALLLLAPLLHSAVDFPLRTLGMVCVGAVLVAAVLGLRTAPQNPHVRKV